MKNLQSLEHRPMSVYDVLDRSAANTQPDQHKDKPEKKKPQNKVCASIECYILCYL